VAANDTDPNGDIDPTSANTGCFTCTDPDNGTLSNNGDGSFTYIPNLYFKGTDSFVYEICDTLLTCNTAVVSISVTTDKGNLPPVVSAGPDQAIGLFEDAILDGTVSDDGLPWPGSVVTTWNVVSGPGIVTFSDSYDLDTTATFSKEGIYVLNLSANDGDLTVNDQVIVTVSTASIIRVPQDYNSIQAAIDAAHNGDVVLVSPGTYSGSFTLNKAVTLASSPLEMKPALPIPYLMEATVAQSLISLMEHQIGLRLWVSRFKMPTMAFPPMPSSTFSTILCAVQVTASTTNHTAEVFASSTSLNRTVTTGSIWTVR